MSQDEKKKADYDQEGLNALANLLGGGKGKLPVRRGEKPRVSAEGQRVVGSLLKRGDSGETKGKGERNTV